MSIDPSEVLVIYLGAGPTGGYQPVGCDERLKAAFPVSLPEAYAAIAKYRDGPEYPPTEWTSNDLAAEQQIYEQKLALAYPELTARAINALACRWSYGWR